MKYIRRIEQIIKMNPFILGKNGDRYMLNIKKEDKNVFSLRVYALEKKVVGIIPFTVERGYGYFRAGIARFKSQGNGLFKQTIGILFESLNNGKYIVAPVFHKPTLDKIIKLISRGKPGNIIDRIREETLIGHVFSCYASNLEFSCCFFDHEKSKEIYGEDAFKTFLDLSLNGKHCKLVAYARK